MIPVTFYLDWELNCQFAGPIWAREKGLYRQAGLEVRLLPPSAQPRKDLIELVLENECTAGSIEENLIVRAAVAGKPVRAVGAMFQESPLVLIAPRGGPVETLSDLPGRRLAMHHDGVHLLEALLVLKGIDVKGVDIAVDNWSSEDLIEGRFDAVQGYAITEVQTLAKRGFEAQMIPLSDRDLSPHSQVIFASKHSIAHHDPHLRAFLRATFDGWRQVLANPDGAASLVAAHSSEHANHTENRVILETIWRYVCGHERGRPLGVLDPLRWRRNLSSYAAYGITGSVDDVELVIEPHLYTDKAGQ